MNIDPYQLTIYRRAGRMWVSPSVLTPGGFESLPGAIEVTDPSRLADALTRAAAQVAAHAAAPSFAGDPFYIVAGTASWDEFLEGLVAVEIGRTRSTTRIELTTREDNALVSTEPPEAFPADLPLDEVARIALDLFATHARSTST